MLQFHFSPHSFLHTFPPDIPNAFMANSCPLTITQLYEWGRETSSELLEALSATATTFHSFLTFPIKGMCGIHRPRSSLQLITPSKKPFPHYIFVGFTTENPKQHSSPPFPSLPQCKIVFTHMTQTCIS